jgi:hypothetical protein
MSRALHAALAALLVASGTSASAQPVGAAGGGGSDGEIFALAKPGFQVAILATARASLQSGETVFVATYRMTGSPTVAHLVAVVGQEPGGLALLGRDDVTGGRADGAPTVAVSTSALPFTPGAIVATVGWRSPDGSVEERQFLFRYGDRKLSPLLALPAARRRPPGTGASELRELELLPTGSGGFKDVRVRTRTLDCLTETDCAERAEVVSYAFDGVGYAPRPYAIPFVERITASSTLAERGGLTDRSAGAAVDGRIDTAWCEGAKGAGWFEKLELTFLPAQRVKAVTVLPGLGAGEDFAERTRPKRIRVLLPDGRKVEGDLADEPKAQRIAIPEGERVFGMTVVILDVNKGKREDACIGELGVEVEP